MTPQTPCVACGGAMIGRLESWLLFCPVCGLWRSLLGGLRENSRTQGALDEARRVAGLEGLREENYARTLALLRSLMPLAGTRLLDVGCSYGWFLYAAKAAGSCPLGLEPDPAIAATAIQRGLPVRIGYFPGNILGEQPFDLIVFNDVLEHLEDLDGALAACRRLLRADGLLVISAPDSGGFLYRLALVLARCGRKELLDRLWQKGYPSPHLSYFHTGNLSGLMRRHAFDLAAKRPLRSLRLRGLWSRLHMDRRPSPRSLVQYLALAAAFPLIVFCCPSDQRLHVFRMAARPSPRAASDHARLGVRGAMPRLGPS